MRTRPLVQGPIRARTAEGASRVVYQCFSNIVWVRQALSLLLVLQMGKLRPGSWFLPRCWHRRCLTPVLFQLSCTCVTPNGRGWVGLSSCPDAQSWRPRAVLLTIWGLAAQHLSPHLGFGEMPTMWVLMNPTPLYRRQRPKRVLRTTTVLPACEMILSRTQVWMRNRDKQKFLQFHFNHQGGGIWDLEC